MSHTLTENPANSDFASGLIVPSIGDPFDNACLVLLDALQELADRTQALKKGVGASTTIAVPMIMAGNAAGMTMGTYSPFWTDANANGTPALFAIPNLTPGVKIVTASIEWDGGNITGTSRTNLPQFMPFFGISRYDAAGGVGVGSTATDTSATTGAYIAPHLITATVNTVVVANTTYYFRITMENGTNAIAGGSTLTGLYLTLAPS